MRMAFTTSMGHIVEVSREAVAWLTTWSWQMLLVLAAAWVALRFDR